jgi:ABC-type multidrug transport system ATPase subunit
MRSLGLLQPTAGNPTMFGETLNGSSKHLSRRIGAALETPAFYPYLSSHDNLRVFAQALGGVPGKRVDALATREILAKQLSVLGYKRPLWL